MANDAGPEAKRWALAATAILTNLTRREPRHDLLGGTAKTPETEGTAKTILANSWGISGRDKLVSTLEWLNGPGHSADYQQAAAAFAAAPPPQRQVDPKLGFVGQYGGEIGNRGLAAWDLGRALAVAGWGYLAGYCTEDEAWGACFSAGVRLRGAYTSWEEYAKQYRLGALFADPNAIGPIDAVIAQLASAPDSPWRSVSWTLDGPIPATLAGAPGIAAGAAPAGGFGPPLGGPGAPVAGAPGLGSPGAAPPGVVGGPPPYGGVPVVAPPPGSPGAPAAYGGVPVIAPPPGAAGAPAAYGGVPVIAPTGGPGPGLLGGATPPVAAAAKKKLGMIIGGGVAALFCLLVVIGLVVHFRHAGGSAPAAEPAAHHPGKHGAH